ncbi:methyl-accepting chemotaxis protein [Cytobacillus massiliigabonensis]|uniref:hypothetical protein n=1 Tax=Cytobacillus massiliigabonensis TaxID=1871011 RepID=UPI000C836C7C|nr:hypothetical protein [Cytobacillus massiliigabonensis]
MAINLQAVLRLDGSQFANQLRQVQRQVQMANRVMQAASTVNTQLSQSMRTTSASARTFTTTQAQLRNAILRNRTATGQLATAQAGLQQQTQSVASSVTQAANSARTFTVSQAQLRNAIQRNQSSTAQLSSTQSQLNQNTHAASNATQHLSQNVSRTSSSFNSIGRTIGGAIRGIGSMTTAVVGLAGAYAGLRGAEKVFSSTIGEAAKYEQSKITISAMLNDEKLGKDYMKLVDSFAIDSPIMDSQRMLANSKSFLTQSKDMKQLEKMWSLAERMAAIDPYQGVEGAVFALREMFSGDAISMVRRFEMPKKVMNEIKKMDLADQLVALDKYFNKIGMTQRLIDDMGGTTLGVWAQIKEQTNVILRTMGQPALMKIKEFLNGVKSGMASVKEVIANRNFFTPEEFKKNLDRAMMFERFKETGAKILENVASGFISATKTIGGWIESIQKNGDFQKQTTLFGKVKWVIGDVYDNFVEWLDGGGRDKIAKTVSDMIQILTASVEASAESIITIGTRIGSGIFEGIASGLKSQLDESWIAQLISDPVGFVIKKATFGKVDPYKDHQAVLDKLAKSDAERKGRSQPKIRTTGNIPKRNGGLDRVPYNGALYSLHKDEMVLPRGEAAAYREGGRSGGGVTITGNTFNVREESDIDKIAEALYMKINGAVEAGA